MTEPRTPTGKRLWDGYGLIDGDYGSSGYLFGRDILAIEQEAAAAVLDRLRDKWDGWQEYGMPPDVQLALDSGDTPHVVWRLLTADPEDEA